MSTETKSSDPQPGAASPKDKMRLSLASEAFSLLGKAIKTISVYKHIEERFLEFVEKPFSAIEAYTTQWGPLTVRVEPDSFVYNKNPIFSESIGGNSIPYRFFGDGIRNIIFRPGLTPDQILRFALICMSDLNSPENLGKDTISLMWEANFDDIEYIAVEGFSMDDMSEEEVEVEVDKIVGYLYSRLQSRSDDFLRFARLSTEDLEMKLEDVEQIRGAIISGDPCTPRQAEEIQEQIVKDEREHLLPKLVNIVFQVIVDSADQLEETSIKDVFSQLLDAMLLQEDFGAINHVLTKFKALTNHEEHGERFSLLRETFTQKMGEAERLDKIGEILNTSRPKNLKDVLRYLFSLDDSAIIPLLEILDRVEIPDHRKLICDALIALGKENPEPFVYRLDSEKSQLVRDMIYIIDHIDFPDKLKMFAKVLSNPSLAVRLEALAIIARSKSNECRQLVSDCLDDPTKEVRLKAAKLLPQYDGYKAFLDLSAAIKSSDFEKRDFQEKIQFCCALGATQHPGAISIFAGMLTKKSFFGLRKDNEKSLLAIAGLSNLASIPSYKLLQAEFQNSSNDKPVQVAAQKGMMKVRDALFGAEGEDAGGES